MKNKKYYILSLVLFLFSCQENKSLRLENEKLKKSNDSLFNILNNSAYHPIIIDNNINKPLTSTDNPSFVVGLVYNQEGLIDSINMKLYFINSLKNAVFVKKIYKKVEFKIENYNYLEEFKLNTLKQGNYLFDGYIVMKNKKFQIQQYFNVE